MKATIDHREAIHEVQQCFTEDEANGYFLNNNWKFDLGFYLIYLNQRGFKNSFLDNH